MTHHFFLFIQIILIVLGISGCNQFIKKDFFETMAVTPTPEKVREYFQVGELITIETVEGTVYQFNLIEVTDTGIIGERQQIPFNEIYQITRKF
jgi:hypothetical protein